MTPLERLLMEELPTGTSGGNRPAGPPPATHPALAAIHRQELETALDGWTYDEPHRRHLTPVPDQPDAETTRSAA